MNGEHKCKSHNYEHFYTKCEKCSHEYCSQHWPICPRCIERKNYALYAGYIPERLR